MAGSEDSTFLSCLYFKAATLKTETGRPTRQENRMVDDHAVLLINSLFSKDKILDKPHQIQ